LEDREITIGRIGGTVTLPASFLLVASANPCPCGWLDSGVRECTCSAFAIERYRSRMSGPLLDRMDLQVFVRPISLKQMRDATPSESSAAIRARVMQARARQQARLARWGLHCNAEMPANVQRETCALSLAAEKALAKVVSIRGMVTARSVDRMIRVARTIADLAEQADIDDGCIFEASAYRALEVATGGPGAPAVYGASQANDTAAPCRVVAGGAGQGA
jgi:magnesium chelatase family protein